MELKPEAAIRDRRDRCLLRSPAGQAGMIAGLATAGPLAPAAGLPMTSFP
jgi:hypothetical protein